MRKFKGIIKYPFLRRLLNSRDYRSHDVDDDGTYHLTMVKNNFQIIPTSVVYYDVFLVR